MKAISSLPQQASSPPSQAQVLQNGLGTRLGFGMRPALIVIDMQRGYTDTQYRLGSDQSAVIGEISRLLACARTQNVNVVYAVTGYEAGGGSAQPLVRKIPALLEHELGGPAVEVTAELRPQPDDLVLIKQYPSAFFATSLAETLHAWQVDTLIVVGCSTSGCVRATVTDAICHGMRPIVPREAVHDRWQSQHEASLIDISAKFGDVMSTDEVLHHLAATPQYQKAGKPPSE